MFYRWLIGLLCLAVSACAGPPHFDSTDAGSTVGSDLDAAGDAGRYPDRPANRSTYQCDDEGNSVWYPPVDAEFTELNRTGGGPTTRQDWVEQFGQDLPERASSLSADPELDPGDDRPSVLLARTDEDVTLHLATIHPRDNYEGSFLYLTLLLNYQPVNARYQLWDAEHESTEAQKTANGVRFPIDRDVEVIDITIPADRFPAEGMYDLGLYFRAALVEGPTMNTFERIRLYRGGYRRRPHSCVTDGGQRLPETEIERDITRSIGPIDAVIYTTGMETVEDTLESIPAQPGETIEVTFAAIPAFVEDELPMALVPLLNAKPVSSPSYLVNREFEDPERRVGFRGTFEVTLPNEPGKYRLVLGTWKYPFLEGGENPEQGFTVPSSELKGFGSNILAFEVQ